MPLTMLKLVDRPSPNNDARASGAVVDILVLHYTGMRTTDAALDRLCDPEASVSAHYLIDTDGTVYRLVPELRRAWHAGVSSWAGDTDVNDRSVGIEMSNPGHEFGYRPFPEAQMASLERLAHDVVTRHRIPGRRVLGHSDVAPTRKQDPGEFFDWARLARAGVGVWPRLPRKPVAYATLDGVLGPGDQGRAVASAQSALAAFGYGITPTGDYDDLTVDVVSAFQRHFRQRRVDGAYDAETETVLRTLLEMVV